MQVKEILSLQYSLLKFVFERARLEITYQSFILYNIQ